jgi:hypothetical protein
MTVRRSGEISSKSPNPFKQISIFCLLFASKIDTTDVRPGVPSEEFRELFLAEDEIGVLFELMSTFSKNKDVIIYKRYKIQHVAWTREKCIIISFLHHN